MANDPLAEIATISAAYSALVTEVQSLLAAQQNATDTVSPDVQASLDKLAALVATPVTAPTPTPSPAPTPTTAASTPPAGS